MYFCPHLCTPAKTFQSVTHPKIALGQARLTLRFFTGELSEKKVYLDSVSILSIVLSLSQNVIIHPLRRPKPGTTLVHICMSSTDICVPYVQLAAYVSYRVPPGGPTCYAYVPTSLTRTPPYPSQPTCTRP
jgi:hypothetical protein